MIRWKENTPGSENRGASFELDDFTNTRHVDRGPITPGGSSVAFRHSASVLAKLVYDKDFEMLKALGGTSELLGDLGTHEEYGLGSSSSAGQPQNERVLEGLSDGDGLGHNQTLEDEIARRREVYGEHALPSEPKKSLARIFYWALLKDCPLLLLLTTASLSLILGACLRKNATFDDDGGDPNIMIEAAGTLVLAVILISIGAIHDWRRESSLQTLGNQDEIRLVTIIRGGTKCIVNANDVVVGDVALLRAGDMPFFDGLYLHGHNVKCDESRLTGSSRLVAKLSFERCHQLRANSLKSDGTDDDTSIDCFILSGSEVVDGTGVYVVLAVGQRSIVGQLRIARRSAPENSFLQTKLDRLVDRFSSFGFTAGFILSIILWIQFLSERSQRDQPLQQFLGFLKVVIIPTIMVIVGVPAGLPLGVINAVSHAIHRMKDAKFQVYSLAPIDRLASVSAACVSQSSCLASGTGDVVAGSIGIYSKFGFALDHTPHHSIFDNSNVARATQVDRDQLMSAMPIPLQSLYIASMTINSLASQKWDSKQDGPILIGNRVDTSLFRFAQDLGLADHADMLRDVQVVHTIPFAADKKVMGIVVRIDGLWRLYVKGASEVLAERCTHHVVVDSNEWTREVNGVLVEEVTEGGLQEIKSTIQSLASDALITIALCYRDFESWPRSDAECETTGDIHTGHLLENLTLVGLVGIQTHLADEVHDSVVKCQNAGISVKLCTGDHLSTAQAHASKCGILTPDGICMEGAAFTNLSLSERLEIVPHLQVLARSTSQDEIALINTLRSLGEVVCALGASRAIQSAQLAIAIDNGNAEPAKAFCQISIPNAKVPSLFSSIMWGRFAHDTTRKIVQYQLTAGLTGMLLVFISSILFEEMILSPAHFLWISIIMDALSVFALAMDHPSPPLFNHPPERGSSPLISVNMAKQIIAQMIFQTVGTFSVHAFGAQILGLHASSNADGLAENKLLVKTLAFNTFVFAQIFNSVNCRQIGAKLNVVEGLTKNLPFLFLISLEISIQVVIVQFGGSACQVTSIGMRGWCASIAIGCAVLPAGAIFRLIPNAALENLCNHLGIVVQASILPITRDIQEDSPFSSQITTQVEPHTFSDHYLSLDFQRSDLVRGHVHRHRSQDETTIRLNLLNFSDGGEYDTRGATSDDAHDSTVMASSPIVGDSIPVFFNSPFPQSAQIEVGSSMSSSDEKDPSSSPSWNSINSSLSRNSPQPLSYTLDANEVMSSFRLHFADIMQSFDRVRYGLSEITRHLDELCGIRDNVLLAQYLDELAVTSSSTTELIVGLSQLSRSGVVYSASASNSTTSFCTASQASGSGSFQTAVLCSSTSSDDLSFYSTEQDFMTGPSDTYHPPGINLVNAFLGPSQVDSGGIQINISNINLHIHGDTFNAPIHGGNVGGRLSHSVVHDNRLGAEELGRLLSILFPDTSAGLGSSIS